MAVSAAALQKAPLRPFFPPRRPTEHCVSVWRFAFVIEAFLNIWPSIIEAFLAETFLSIFQSLVDWHSRGLLLRHELNQSHHCKLLTDFRERIEHRFCCVHVLLVLMLLLEFASVVLVHCLPHGMEL